MHPDTLVTIATFTHTQEAVVIRARLEWEGIPCHLKDEHTVQVQPFYSNAIGGVKLQVRAGDAERAHDLLRKAEVMAGDEAVPGPVNKDIEGDMPGGGPMTRHTWAWFIVGLVLLLALLWR